MTTASKNPLALFLCTGNSARSIMAEAILRCKAGDRFDVASAGLEPKGVHPMTVEVLREIGVPTDGLRSKPISEFLGRVSIRYAITVCAHADAACPRVFPFATRRMYWPFADPPATPGTDADRLAKFREVRDEIARQLAAWLAEEQ